MKTLSDGTPVSGRSYYYLLDWNESDDWEYMSVCFGKMKLLELTIDEYRELWEYATRDEYTLMRK